MSHKSEALEQHNREIQLNLELWEQKPLLQEIYYDFYRMIRTHLFAGNTGEKCVSVELGSGIGKIKDIIPNCITTDLFANPWVEQVETAYSLSFNDESIDNLILFDVFHHLRHPGTALNEFSRVLTRGGRVIIFEPCISLLGMFIYGAMHPEPLGLEDEIELYSPAGWSVSDDEYYAAQGNAMRLFVKGEFADELPISLQIKHIERLVALSYVCSGGYSGLQLYPRVALPLMRLLDRTLPQFFDTRLLVALEKR